MTEINLQTVNEGISLLDNVAAPAPRYLMRLSQVDKLIRSLPTKPETFLEIGPGMGDISDYLVRRFPDIRGHVTDISQASVQIVAQRLNDAPNLSVAVSEFTAIDGSNQFDLIIACEVFEHIKDDDAAFDAVHRLLRTDGHFLFSAPAFMDKWGPADEYGGHVRRYEKESLWQQFENHGFEISKFWSYGFPVTNLIGPISRRYYRNVQRDAPLDQQHATKRSGTERTVATKLRKIPYVPLMAPFFLCQHLFRERNVGDGYVVLARKVP